MNSALKNLAILFVVNGTLAVIGFLSQAGIANVLGGEEFGRYSFYLAISAYAAVAIRFGRERTMLRELVQEPEKLERTVIETFFLSLSIGGVITLFFIAGSLLFPDFFTPGMLCVVCGISLVSFDLQPLYDSKHLMGRHALYNAIYRMVYFALIWGVIFFAPARLSITWIGFALILGITCSLGIQFREAKRRFGIRFVQAGIVKGVLGLLRRGFPVALVSWLELAYGPLLIILLKWNCDETTAGIYGVAALFMYGTTLVWQQIARIGNPMISKIVLPEVNRKERFRKISLYICVLFLCLLPFALVMIVFPERLIKLFFAKEYLPAAKILPLFGGLLFLFPLNVVSMQYVLASRKDREYLCGVAIATIGGGISSYFLVSNYGLFGAAWGYIATVLLGTAINTILAFGRVNCEG